VLLEGSAILRDLCTGMFSWLNWRSLYSTVACFACDAPPHIFSRRKFALWISTLVQSSTRPRTCAAHCGESRYTEIRNPCDHQAFFPLREFVHEGENLLRLFT